MSVRERLETDMKDAMRTRDALRLETIRGARGAIRNKEIEVGSELDEAAVLRVIRTLVKQRDDSIEQYRNAGREDLAAKEAMGANGFLPGINSGHGRFCCRTSFA